MKPARSDAIQRSQGLPLCAAVLALSGALAHAEETPPHGGSVPHAQLPAARVSLVIEEPPALRAGAAASIEVVVRSDEAEGRPLLLTPSVEGEALRVVRGRLLRADARRDADGTLHFAVPLLARSPGTAVLHVDLLTYRCAPDRGCEAVHVSRTRILQVIAS